MIRSLILSILVFGSPIGNASPSGHVIWFDLGEVLVDTKKGTFKDMDYMPGSKEYLELLDRRGVTMGLIVNIPETWGDPDNPRDVQAKINHLIEFIKKGWDPAKSPFNWSLFSKILVPRVKAERKPAPFLFETAIKLSSGQKLRPIYQGENQTEVQQAMKLGLPAYQTDLVNGKVRFLNPNDFKDYFNQTLVFMRRFL